MAFPTEPHYIIAIRCRLLHRQAAIAMIRRRTVAALAGNARDHRTKIGPRFYSRCVAVEASEDCFRLLYNPKRTCWILRWRARMPKRPPRTGRSRVVGDPVLKVIPAGDSHRREGLRSRTEGPVESRRCFSTAL